MNTDNIKEKTDKQEIDNTFSTVDYCTNIYKKSNYEKDNNIKLDFNNQEDNIQLNISPLVISEQVTKEIEETKKDKEEKAETTNKQKPLANTFIQAVQDLNAKKLQEESLRKKNTEFPYKPVPLLTNAELQLFHFMKNNLVYSDRIEIFTKVRLADIINLDKTITTDKSYLYKITNKHIDFLICKIRTLEIICAVELDDYTHMSEDRRYNDMFKSEALRVCGIQLQRIKTKIAAIETCDLRFINEAIYTAFAPKCAVCGRKMVLRTNNRSGHKFYACEDNINCRFTMNV